MFKYIENLSTTWEQEPLERLATEKNLMSFVHDGFWQPMDTLRDKQKLNQIYDQGRALANVKNIKGVSIINAFRLLTLEDFYEIICSIL